MAQNCSMLINQNKCIDGETVGHACYNEAKYNDGKYFYCEYCLKKILDGEDENITKPGTNCVEEWLRLKNFLVK
jgi:hypothetical protein